MACEDRGDGFGVARRAEHTEFEGGDRDVLQQRARLARDRIRKPLRACERDWIRFGNAVEANPEATALVERFSLRLNRTIEIIFSGAKLDLIEMPAQLSRALDMLD